MGDPQEIPSNLILGGGAGEYALLHADSSVEYNELTEIANFLELYVVNAQQFQRLIEMMNDPQIIEAARSLAWHSMQNGGSSLENQLNYCFRLVTGRKPQTKEINCIKSYIICKHIN